jgi:hypothetical protein
MPDFLTSSKHTIQVDQDDLEYLETQRVYVTFLPSDRPRAQIRLDGKLKNLAVHLMRRAARRLPDGAPIPDDMVFAPKNGVDLDFRKDNLLPVSRGVKSNLAAGPREGSRYKGISLVKATGRWRARIQLGEKMHEAAGYLTEKDAAIAYDIMALRLHGHLAALNFPERKAEFIKLIGGPQAVGAGIKARKKRRTA